MIRFLIGVGLFAAAIWLDSIMLWSKVVLVGLLLAFILAALGLWIGTQKDSKSFERGLYKVSGFIAWGSIVWFICHTANRSDVIALFGGTYFLAVVCTLIYMGFNAEKKKRREERKEDIKEVVDAINNLNEEQKESVKKAVNKLIENEEK